MNFLEIKTVIRQAQADANLIFNDVPKPQDLTPETYDGDGEAFMFSWVENLQHEVKGADSAVDLARDIYLAAFWVQIDALKAANVLTR